ncbi:hypothetical protein L226DRAFT_611828 [Lentinus tigrinus ALCF2SS1-7]|uniref:CCZ1/INTU/HSP4 first Longin domain-containing protein n=1 Tax=Lentinus tigrinus ALCF2SS1-6 TaxID=1328759 RepID=A0A5C2SLS2_9APHY|nr:hypothetical protein L227DRAFT_591441 [Lentinus tigrinus ALCF2SS1-6]RPD76447.1 hypothetical protein L226DRAFT_611828 [Lentinus tigrinus ALCF2SS1-7]
MSRIPPSLLYLTIYNPTLKPELLDPDNEDAEEQAHILFYTAREHAVSRDRTLRQVGLAKALVNFSEMFNAGVPCENVHSQARRMIMFSPEPNFWIHACYEVAKTPRPTSTSKKSKDAKGKSKGKEKEQQQPARTVMYDYHDGSVHDIALRTHFERGYEEFKLLHGTFNSVMSSLGQQALELQLERFFTVWAWKWDTEDDDFASHLGVPLHPLHAKLTPLLDKFASALPDELTSFALIPPYVVPPRLPKYPPALVRYILARVPPPPTPVPRNQSSTSATSTPSVPSGQAIKPATSSDQKSTANAEGGFTMPIPIPTMPTMPNVNFNLDMKNVKWNWPTYLTFGRGGGTSKSASPIPPSPSPMPITLATVVDPPQVQTPENDDGLRSTSIRRETLDVDTASLLEAITTESMGSYTRAASPAPSALSKSSQLGESGTQSALNTGGSVSPVDDASSPDGSHDPIPDTMQSPPLLPTIEIGTRPARSFLASTVHIAIPTDVHATRKQRVLHLTQGECTVAIVADVDHDLDLTWLADETVSLIGNIEEVVVEEAQMRDKQIPSAAKILQPQDRYIISKNEYTSSSAAGFPSRSEHLYNGQHLLRSGLDILEVFSRGQNPQHWHIGKRGLGNTAEGRQVDDEVFMEVARKETTLTDVDNELAGVVRRFVEQA